MVYIVIPVTLRLNEVRVELPVLFIYGCKHIVYNTRFNILKLCIVPTQCICVFHMVLTVNIDFSVDSTNWLAL
jgi:Ca2+/H+ antiporter